MLKELKINHREIGRLRFEGLTPSEIAKRTGKNLQTIYAILRDPLCKGYMDGLADKADKSIINVREKLVSLNQKALTTIENLLDPVASNIPASVALSAAKDVLDRNGYKPVEQHNHAYAFLTLNDLKELSDRAKEVDTDYIDISSETTTVQD